MIGRRPIPCLLAAICLCVCLPQTGAVETDHSLPGSASPGGPRPLELTAASAVLIDPASGQVLYEQAADEVRYPASLTKIMAALVALEEGDPEDVVTVSANAAAVGEATAHLMAGDKLSLDDLLTAVLLPSANDAAVAVAEHINSSLGAFVDRMNRRAAELGLEATHFENPHGLHDEGHVSSARDLARLSCQALALPEFRRIVALPEAEIALHRAGEEKPRKIKLANNNRLLRSDNGNYWELADGIKTGYTRHAGRCLAASASKDGWQLVCVVLGCENSWADARALLQWGFDNFAARRIVSARETTAYVHVIDGSPPIIAAVAKSSIDALVPLGGPAPLPRVSESYPTAPISQGSKVGELVVSRLDGTELRATLVAPHDVPQSLAARLREHLGGVIAAIVALALLGALCVHGAVAKAAGARRRRGTKSVRRDDKAGPRDR
jgi:D-alanyl-D-alanine carboxypeptidase (penicillin-binding protein 5/6)